MVTIKEERTMKLDTVVFDLDGTLLDTLDDITDSVNQILSDLNYPERTPQEVASFIGNGVKQLIRLSLPEKADEASLLKYVGWFKDNYAKNMYNKTRPYQGIQDLLEKLSSMKIKMAVLSNKPDTYVKPLCELHFKDRFPIAQGEMEGAPRKPSPESLLNILHKLHAGPAQALYVGDSEVDILTAHNSGAISAGVLWGLRSEQVLRGAGAHHIIHSPQKLLDILN